MFHKCIIKVNKFYILLEFILFDSFPSTILSSLSGHVNPVAFIIALIVLMSGAPLYSILFTFVPIFPTDEVPFTLRSLITVTESSSFNY